MEGGTFCILLLSGLCALSSCLSHQYHLVNEPKTWTEAQRYCREKYTDLATIDNMEDMARVYGASSGYTGRAWIGLYGDINTWSWSQGRSPFNREGETVFTNWHDGQPNNHEGIQFCVGYQRDGKWNDYDCSWRIPVICTQGVTFVYINQSMTWTEAQSYCRQHHTDLASVRSQTENQQIVDIKPADVMAWIGLYRDPWKWSDGSNSSFTSWANDEPNDYRAGQSCTAVGLNSPFMWKDWYCTDSYPFFCNIVPVQQQVVRMSLTRENSGVDLEDPAVKEAILQQVQVKLREKGLTEDFQLRWRKQPDGKVFHKEEDESSQRKRKKRERKPVLTKREL